MRDSITFLPAFAGRNQRSNQFLNWLQQMSTGHLHLNWFESHTKIKTRYPDGYLVFMAEDEGFEPPQTESESGVLPLHKSSIFPWGTLLLYPIFRKCQGQFLEFPGFFSDCQVSANRKKMHRMISGLNGQILRLSGGHFLFVFVEFAECPWYIVKYRMDKNAYRLSAVNK